MADISRRTLLNRSLLVGALAGGGLLGLTHTVHHKRAVPPPPAPAALVAALGLQRQLQAGYDLLAGGANRRILALRADVVQHGQALSALLELYPGWRLAPSPSGSVSPSAPGAPSDSGAPSGSTATGAPGQAALATASSHAAQALGTVASGWPAAEPNAGQVVPVLASISACLATHAQVLR